MSDVLREVDIRDINEKFWKTIEQEKKIFEINSRKTSGDKNGYQSKPNH